jgi:hypothetical protein
MPGAWLTALALFLCAALTARAQFTGWATTGDGSQLYYSMREGNATGAPVSKVFVDDANRVRLYADSFPGFPSGADLATPQVSGDGSLVAYTGTYTSTAPCAPFERHPRFGESRWGMDRVPFDRQFRRNHRSIVEATRDHRYESHSEDPGTLEKIPE